MNRSDKQLMREAHGGNGHADSFKSPERLEQEVSQTRARIEERLDTLTSRLSPGELLDQALDMAREHGGEFSHNLGSQVKQNPLPLLLTSIGLSWLMMSSRHANAQVREDYYRYGEEGTGPGALDKVKDTMGNITERAQHLKERAQEAAGRAQHMKSAVGGQVRHASYTVRGRVRSTQQQLADFFQEQPILAGSLGVALGAALGALLPPTEAEARLMGEESERALDKARSLAEEGYDKARDTAKDAFSSVKESAAAATPSQGAGMPGYESRLSGSSGIGSQHAQQGQQSQQQGQQQSQQQGQQGQQSQQGQQGQQQGQQGQAGQQQGQQSPGLAGSQAQQGAGSVRSGASDLPISYED